MAKRYHQSKEDRMHESRGERRHLGSDYYAGEDGRRTQEMEDAGMIKEDRSAIANMPQQWMLKPYPRGKGYLPGDMIDDTIRGVDAQEDADNSQKMRHLKPHKY